MPAISKCLMAVWCIGGVALTLPHGLAAQVPEKFENLRYFPKDIARDTLLQYMRGFTASLGVRCEFCHAERQGNASAALSGAGGGGAGRGGRGAGPPLDFASDDKVMKRNARYMLFMADTINNTLLVSLPERSTPPVRVQCVTCHRGLAKPTTLDAALSETLTKWGADSAAAQYRRLRETT